MLSDPHCMPAGDGPAGDGRERRAGLGPQSVAPTTATRGLGNAVRSRRGQQLEEYAWRSPCFM